MWPLDGMLLPMLLAAAPASSEAVDHAATGPVAGQLSLPLLLTVLLGMLTVAAGFVFCLIRLWRGPSLADRVVAADLLALHVIAAVILLTIYLADVTYFGSILGIAIIGFASTVAFAQLIGANRPAASGAEVSIDASAGHHAPLDHGDVHDAATINRCPDSGEPLPDPRSGAALNPSPTHQPPPRDPA